MDTAAWQIPTASELGEIPLAKILGMLGELEQLKVSLWLRLLELARTDTKPVLQTRGELMSVAEVAAALRFSRGHVYELIRSGELPALRHGRAVRVRREDLDSWEARHRTLLVDSRTHHPPSSAVSPLGGVSKPKPRVEAHTGRQTERREPH
jgi:excisionase family DNA binding protein